MDSAALTASARRLPIDARAARRIERVCLAARFRGERVERTAFILDLASAIKDIEDVFS
jgi:hypothetical protein